MAFQLDTRLPLLTQGANAGQGVQQGLQIGGMLADLQNARELQPIRKQILEQSAQEGKLLNEQNQQAAAQANQAQLIDNVANAYSSVKSLVDAGKFSEAADQLEANKAVRAQSGATNFEDTDAAIAALRGNNPKEINRIKLMGEQAIKISEARKNAELGTSVENRAFEQQIAGFTPEEKEKARKVKAGLTPRAVGSSSQTIAGTGQTEVVAESEAAIAAKKAAAVEAAKLAEQLKLKPEVEAAVNTAVADALAVNDQEAEGRSNKKAFKIYEAGIGSLLSGLSGTSTGPFVGLIPAITSSAQIASGAVAAMAPILKTLFREAGEGGFSDGDQKLLLDMIPTRSDRKEAIVAKLSNIDTIVRAKLGQPDKASTKDTGITIEQFKAMTPEQRQQVLQQQKGK